LRRGRRGGARIDVDAAGVGSDGSKPGAQGHVHDRVRPSGVVRPYLRCVGRVPRSGDLSDMTGRGTFTVGETNPDFSGTNDFKGVIRCG